MCLHILARNGTLTEYATMHTGHTGMEKFGYFDKLNGLDHLPHWDGEPCRSIQASEGSFFPPRDLTKKDTVYIYDKDLCRTLPLVYREPVEKDGKLGGVEGYWFLHGIMFVLALCSAGISADLYTLAEDAYGPPNET
uniref:Uncharacterized protein n=1 Tax=Anopheles stephensi TaxID=30069 RepID=A0A182YD62_ANOST